MTVDAFTSVFVRSGLGPLNSSSMPISNEFLNLQATEQEIRIELEPIQDEEVARLRSKVLEMGNMNSEGISLREQELAKMVLRLTEASRPSAAQITSQAAIIVDLSIQRDYLAQQVEEERGRWESEREGWQRASEALIAQRNTEGHYSNRHQELERQCSILQTDNEDLRRREQHLLRRLTSLEDELVKLKPLLLLNPFPATASESSLAHASATLTSLPFPPASAKVAVRAQRSRRKKREAKSENLAYLDQAGPSVTVNSGAVNHPSRPMYADVPNTSALNSDEFPVHDYSPPPIQEQNNLEALPFQSTSSEDIVRRTEPPGTLLLWPSHVPRPIHSQTSPEASSAKVGTSSPPRSNGHFEKEPYHSTANSPHSSFLPKSATSLTSDARMEHLLLAARKIGRKRAFFAAGIIDAKLMKEQDERKEKKDGRKGTSASQRLAVGGSSSTETSKGNGEITANVAGKTQLRVSKSTSSWSEREHLGMADDEIIVSSSKQNRTRHLRRPKPRTLSESSSAGPSQRTQLTGMDSLLSAAKSMMDSSSDRFAVGGELNKGRINTADSAGSHRHASELGAKYENVDMLPPLKRRKSIVLDSNRPRRAPSALDVLADQAAAAVSTPTVGSDHDSTPWKCNAAAEGEHENEDEDDDPTVYISTRFNSTTRGTEGSRGSSRRSSSSRLTMDVRLISSAKSPTGKLEN